MTKIEIIQKIEELFYKKTFSEVSMQEIANEIGMKKASLYHHFSSKNDIIIEVLENSFHHYFAFIQEILRKKPNEFLSEFIYFPQKSNNIFSIINQNGFCDNEEIKENIFLKQKEINRTITLFFQEKYHFSQEKTFLLISLLEDISRKKCIFGKCPIEVEVIITEIEKLFFGNMYK